METWEKDYLKEEYFKLQDQYEDFDRRALQIKGWIGAGAIAGMAIGFDSGKSGDGAIWVLIAIMAGCFWYLEAKWKVFQYSLAGRIRMIEALFRGDEGILIEETKPLQMYCWWFESYREGIPIYPCEKGKRPEKEKISLREAAFQGFVMMPYALIVVICVTLTAYEATARFVK